MPCAAAGHGSENPFSLVHVLLRGSYMSIRSYSVRLFPVKATPPVASTLLPDTAPFRPPVLRRGIYLNCGKELKLTIRLFISASYNRDLLSNQYRYSA